MAIPDFREPRRTLDTGASMEWFDLEHEYEHEYDFGWWEVLSWQ
jgi:hypothetical protein